MNESAPRAMSDSWSLISRIASTLCCKASSVARSELRFRLGEPGGFRRRSAADAAAPMAEMAPRPRALGLLPPAARRALVAQLATIDAAAASVVTATHDTGQLRLNGRRELSAIEALEHDVTDGTLEQSTTAVLDKISGAVLIGGRQRQARAQLLAGLVEQLLSSVSM